MKTAFIVGILGQDGFYLRDILLKQGYNVVGFDRNINVKNNLNDGITVLELDLTDYKQTSYLFKKYKPTHVFNLAGVSNVFDPWNNVDEIVQSTLLLPQTLMECIINNSPETIFCQASSCLVFGKTKTTIQNELTERNPIYPYGFCKNFIDGLIDGYRKEKGLNFCSAIFYNHDSPQRGDNFFIKRLINFAKKLDKNPSEKLLLNNLNVNKDIGYAKEYMEAFYLMGNAKVKDDYIISSGNLTNLNDVVKYVSKLCNKNLFDNIVINDKKINHDEAVLYGDNSKIIIDLNWKPKIKYEEIVGLIWNKAYN
jgi:GDPmannose 4,6-dehydratase